MEVKKRNMTELVLHGALLVLLFIPGMYEMAFEQIIPEYSKLGGWTEKWTVVVSFWDKNYNQSHIAAFLLWLLIIVACVAFVLCLMQFLGKGKKANLKICLPFPFVELGLFLIPTFLTRTSWGSYGNYTSYYRYSPYALFPVGLALLAALILITLIGYTRASKRGVVEVSDRENRAYSGKRSASTTTGVSDVPNRENRADSGKRSVPPTTRASADELRKYKELLDDGVITQEEFDRIKRQMLGL